MNKIIITDYIKKPDIEKKILKNYDIICLNEINEDKFDKIIFDAFAILVWHAKITKKTISKLKKCKAIIRYGVGYENIDLIACKKNGIPFANTPDYGTDEVSDTAIAFILNMTRGINYYNFISKNLTNSWQENLKYNLRRSNKIKIGIVGAGRIGSSVIIKLKNIGFQCSFFDPYKEPGYEKILNCNRYTNLKELLKNSDVVTIHVPLTKETKGIINKDFLKNMKKNSYLVNTARGKLIDNLDDIYDALINKKLDSVALDVLPFEPPNKYSKLIKSWKDGKELSSKILITNHTSYYTKDSFNEMRIKASKNILNVTNKKELESRII